nr:PDZ domain-containing protein [uncultured Campylobacter sp.]
MKRAAFSRRLDAVLGLALANLPLRGGRICTADKQNGPVNSGLNSATSASQICAARAVKSAVNLSSNSRTRSVKFDASLNPREISQKTSLGAKTATNLTPNLTENLARKICSPVFAVFMICAFAASLRAEPRPTQDDFNACFEKNLPAMVNVAGNGGIAITPNLIAVPKGEIPVKNYVKFDPYLGLYLVASDAKLEPVKMADDNTTKKSDWVSVTRDLNATVYGHVKAQAQALGELDALTFDVNGTGAVLSPCCKLRGIAVGGDKFVPSRYLRHFAAYKDVYYGDVGAVFEERDGRLYVKGVDPLGRGAALMAGDEILSVNGEKMQSLRELNERILFAAKGERLKFEIKRGEDVVKFSVAVSDEVKKEQKTAPKTDENITKIAPKPQPAPNTDASSVRKLYGLTFDEKLRVKSVDGESDAARFGLRVGDKLIQVGAKVVKNRKEAIALIAKNRGQRLLFRRDGFDFFYNAR